MKRPLVVAPLVLLGCGIAASKVGARATFDLQCPEAQLELTEIKSEEMYGARGCGRQGTYVFRNGQAILNSPVSEVAAPPRSGSSNPPPSK